MEHHLEPNAVVFGKYQLIEVAVDTRVTLLGYTDAMAVRDVVSQVKRSKGGRAGGEEALEHSVRTVEDEVCRDMGSQALVAHQPGSRTSGGVVHTLRTEYLLSPFRKRSFLSQAFVVSLNDGDDLVQVRRHVLIDELPPSDETEANPTIDDELIDVRFSPVQAEQAMLELEMLRRRVLVAVSHMNTRDQAAVSSHMPVC